MVACLVFKDKEKSYISISRGGQGLNRLNTVFVREVKGDFMKGSLCGDVFLHDVKRFGKLALSFVFSDLGNGDWAVQRAGWRIRKISVWLHETCRHPGKWTCRFECYKMGASFMKSQKVKNTNLAYVEFKIIILRPDLQLCCQQLLCPAQTAIRIA